MNFKSIFFMLVFTPLIINSQWVLQNPRIQAERLGDIVTLDSLTSYCAGSFGRIMKSTDKGVSWKVVNTGVNELFIRIFFINSTTGWALTYDSNKLYKTTDGGFSWLLASEIDSNRWINDIFFINGKEGFLTGDFNSLIRTDDGGKTWTTINITNTTYSGTASIFFLNEKVGFVTMNSYSIFKTNDSGITWKQVNTDRSFGPVMKIFCLDSLKIFTAGQIDQLGNLVGFLYTTVDGGNNWNKIYFDKPIQNVFFIDLKVGAIIKENKILVTPDGGINWKETGISASRFSFFKDKTALAVSGSNLIKKSIDFWTSFIYVTPTITSNCLYSVSPLDSMNIATCGNNETIVITNDGGKSWQKVHDSGAQELNDILYINKQEILACGRGIILSSSDGGKTWSRDTLSAEWISDIEFVNDSLIYAAGSNQGKAALFFSKNKGRNWNSYINFPLARPIDKIKFSNNHLGWITAGNELYKTTAGGLSWIKISGVTILYGAVDARGDSAWFSNGNSVLVTTDAGGNWNKYKMFDYKGTIFSTYCISMKNSLEGSVGLYDGRILDTHDGGKSWDERVQLTSTPIYDLKYYNGNYGWAVGDVGLILKYSNTQTEIRDENLPMIPQNFYLEQNYPNPFNPSTVISYRIPVSSNVTLKVYDTLGREVASLVNEEKLPGNYEVKFDGSNLSIGVYFYRLQTGTFSETKKFVLIK